MQMLHYAAVGILVMVVGILVMLLWMCWMPWESVTSRPTEMLAMVLLPKAEWRSQSCVAWNDGQEDGLLILKAEFRDWSKLDMLG